MRVFRGNAIREVGWGPLTHGARKARSSFESRCCLLAIAVGASLITPSLSQAQTPQDGQVVASRLTQARGGTWLAGSAANSGHWWLPDQTSGFCRLDPAPAGSPAPFQISTVANTCSVTAKAPGQVAVGNPNGINGLPANAKLIFVPDGSVKSVNVVRFVFNPANETITTLSTISVPNVTAVGGGKGGGRPLSVVLGPNGRDLYVGYKASGDIMMIPNATSNQPGAATQIGSTSDGRGITAMTFFNNDLYLTEAGGPALTVIPDPSGVARAACSSGAVCHAVPPPGFPAGVMTAPSGITSNGSPGTPATFLFIGDAPLNGTPGVGIVQWNVATRAVTIYSQFVNPSYNGTVDGITTNLYSQYSNPVGLTFHPNGELYVADDPTFTCTLAACPTLQGHLWRVPVRPGAPTITSVSPQSGVPEGGTSVAITGTGFSTNAGATSITFGGAAATAVVCSTTKACTLTSPAGAGTVNVVATVAGQSSTPTHTAADQFTYQPITVTGVSPASGPVAGGTAVTVFGTGFGTDVTKVSIKFGNNAAPTPTSCASTSCVVLSPAGIAGPADVKVKVSTNAGTSDESNVSAADLFTYIANTTPFINSLCVVSNPANPAGSCFGTTGLVAGGTMVRISGGNMSAATAVTFGANTAAIVSCQGDGSSCTVITPANPTGAGTLAVQVTAAGQTSLPASFTYANASASVYAFGITAPKGGMVWIPGSLGGHWWSSDHANGFCRLDLGPQGTFAINYAVCDDGSIGSPGQAAYDPTSNFIYVPDNAVKSTAVWRLKFDPTTETIVGAPVGMVPLADVRTLKPNGMALGPSPNGGSLSLYVTDLTEANIRRIDNPAGDPRLQTLTIIGTTGDGRGANGTIGFLGNILYVSENRAASFLDVTRCIDNSLVPCSTAAGTPSTIAGMTGFVPLPSGVFIAGVATDPVHNLVYAADSPGGSGATIWRYNPVTAIAPVVYLQRGVTPNPGANFSCATTCTRPTDAIATSPAFSFAFGLSVDPATGSLFVTEDATAGNRSGRGRAWTGPFIP